ncbi:MAG: NAD(P)/FAD-dependent oxidoreductase [Myxococcales bacterium]|nr:NAD(P)/FAD-dependent oxidoreductase [Myxococcales bacterium]
MRRIVIVGGGPVGLVTALHARRAGHAVTVFERGGPGRDKACGEGLMPGGVAVLGALGVEVAADGWAPFRGIRYVDGPLVAEGDFPTGEGWGVRRTALHGALARRAEAAGVDLRWGVEVEGLTPTGARVGGATHGADLVVGADGLRSRVRGWAGLAAPTRRPVRLGVRRHVARPPWSDRVEVHWGDGVEAYVTPAGPERVGVAFLFSPPTSGDFEALLGRFPALRARLDGAPVDSRVRGAGPLAQGVRGVLAGRVALVGDAAGYLDAITGEGLTLGFQQAEALVRRFTEGRLDRYAADHARLVRAPFAWMRFMLWLRGHPAVRRRLLRGLADHPDVFGRALALNDGAALEGADVRRAARLLRRVVAPR